MTQGQNTVAVNRVDEVKVNDPALVSQAITDLSKKDKNNLEGIDLNNFANNGFQEVRNKKTTKDPKKDEAAPKGGRGKSQGQPSQSASTQAQPGQQPTQQPPPLMAINAQPPSKQSFERSRPCKLPPRLAKARENNRLQKQQAAAAQQHDVSEMNKVNQNINMYPLKDTSGPAPPPPVNAWDKPINASLRPSSPGTTNISTGLQLSASLTDNCNLDGAGSGGSSQRSSPAVDKLGREARDARDVHDQAGSVAAKDPVLDGASPPVQTIIFENTNYKQAPSASSKFPSHPKGGSRIDKPRDLDSGSPHGHQHPHSSNLGFDMKSDAMDTGDMKLDFTFECSDLDDKGVKSMGLPRTMHSTLPSTADLNFKIAAVKKVWETMPTGQSHSDESQAYAPPFATEAALDAAAFRKAVESPQMQMDENSEVVYSPGPQMQPNPNSYGVSGVTGVSAVPGNSASPNVCKVKPQPSVMPPGPQLSPPPPFNSQPTSHIANFQSFLSMQPNMSSSAAQFGGISAIPSPPTVLYNSSQAGIYQTFLGDAPVLGGQPLGGQPLGGQPLGGQPLGGQALGGQPLGGQPLGGQTLGGQPLGGQPLGGQPLGGQPLGGQPLGGQPLGGQLGGQGRSQFTQFPPYQLSQGLTGSTFNQQNVYVHQSAPPPHPPNAGPDLYQPMSQYRIQPPTGPFGQSQQLNSNPSTVLISSSSNSLMSASVKPSSHSGQIGAIGTKGGAPSPYQTSAPQSQLFIPYDPSQVLSVNQNYLSNSPLVQRAAPVQNMQSSSYYSTSAGAQAGFYQTGSSLQAAPAAPQLHQTATPFGLQNFSSHAPFLSSNLQIAAAVQQQQQQQQQYRNSQPSYLKGGLGQQSQPPPPSSPSSQQPDLLPSVFSSGSQIPSPKSRDSKKSQSGPQGGQGAQNQHSPTPQHQGDPRSGSGGAGPSAQGQPGQGHNKYSSYQMSQQSHMMQQRGNQMNMGPRSNMGQSGQSRYPAPIQRPNSYNQSGMSSGGNMNMNRHRTPAHNTSRPPPSVGKQNYYGSSQGGPVKMESSGNSEAKPENSTPEHKDSSSSPTSSAAESSAPSETAKDEAPAASAE